MTGRSRSGCGQGPGTRRPVRRRSHKSRSFRGDHRVGKGRSTARPWRGTGLLATNRTVQRGMLDSSDDLQGATALGALLVVEGRDRDEPGAKSLMRRVVHFASGLVAVLQHEGSAAHFMFGIRTKQQMHRALKDQLLRQIDDVLAYQKIMRKKGKYDDLSGLPSWEYARFLTMLESTEFSATRRVRAAPVPGAAVRG